MFSENKHKDGNFWVHSIYFFINPLEPSCNYMSHLLQQSVTSFCIYGCRMILGTKSNYSLNSINQLIFVRAKSFVSLAARAKFLDII
jgi:hypothetical protein